jgi:hypothetical protein
MNIHEKVARLAVKLKRQHEALTRCRLVCQGRTLGEVIKLVDQATSEEMRPVLARLVKELVATALARSPDRTPQECLRALAKHPQRGIFGWFYALQAGNCSLPGRLPDEIIRRFASEGEFGRTDVSQLCVECKLALPQGRAQAPAPEGHNPLAWQSCPHCGGEVRYLKLWVTGRYETG